MTHQHNEAFRLMTYGPKGAAHGSGSCVRVWNSRDGVTPFGIRHPRTGEELFHLPPWQLDPYEPGYVPDVGEWVFIDLHPERALQLAFERVELFWDHPMVPLSARGVSKEDAAQMFLKDMLSRPGTPDLVQVTEPLHELFVDRAASLAR